MKKKLSTAAISVILIIGSAITSFAGQWKQEGSVWKYQNDTGSYATGWNWIDGKSYFFDANGKMLANTITPDGYSVNSDGAWVVNGVVQTQYVSSPIKANADNYDPQYPLKGYMEQWFVTSPVTGTTAWKSDPNNFFYESNNHLQYALDLTIRNRDPLSLNYFGDGKELAAIAKLTDYPTTGLEGVDQEKMKRLAIEIRNFLNRFDWRNATDYEKAKQIAKRITKADYLNHDGTQYSYSCLVDGKADCNGYTNAAYLLAACVGLPSNGLGFGNHIYPVFLVDGMWLAYEPTSKDNYFTVADVYFPSFYLSGEPQLSKLGEYCEATGYEIPVSVEGKFPNITYGYIYGERASLIKFN